MIGRLHHVIVDCPDPGALAEFYALLLGLRIGPKVGGCPTRCGVGSSAPTSMQAGDRA
jgi:hypothetical protein